MTTMNGKFGLKIFWKLSMNRDYCEMCRFHQRMIGIGLGVICKHPDNVGFSRNSQLPQIGWIEKCDKREVIIRERD